MSALLHRQLHFFRFCVILLVVACGGGDSPTAPTGPTTPLPNEPEPPSGPQVAAAPTVTGTEISVLVPVLLGGLPTGRSDLFVELAEPGASSPIVIGDYVLPLIPEGGTAYRLHVPLHPSGDPVGGVFELRVRGEGFVTEALELTLRALPEAPGSFGELVDVLQELLDLRFEALGTTRAEVLAADWETGLDPSLFPIAIAQTVLDDPSHDRDLRDLLAGAASFETLLGTSDFDLDLLDRMTAAGGLVSVLSDHLADERARSLGVMGAAAEAASYSGGPARAVSISSAPELDGAMQRAWAAAREGDPDSATGGLLQAYGLTLGALGLVTGPGGAAVTAGLGTVLWAYQTYLEGTSKLLPKEFVEGSLSFDIDLDVFEEDRSGPGTWSNVRVSAQSEGWTLDKAIADLLLQIAGNADAYTGWINRVGAEASSLIRDIGVFVTGTQLGSLPIAESGLVQIDPQVWADIDVTGAPWSQGRVAEGDAIVISSATTYEPNRAGDALLTVETSVSRFGDARPAFHREQVRVEAIEITIAASATTVEPGDIVELQIEVVHALDVSLDWTLSPGAEWVQEPAEIGGGVWFGTVQTPADADEFPVRVTFTSTATGGARSMPGAPVRESSIEISSVEVIVEPTPVMLEPGQSRQFEATVLGTDNKAVTWSAIGPSGGAAPITSSGLFTAPDELGSYLVVATSVADPSAEGYANVTVVGQCYWTLSIDGSLGGNWSGAVASHVYAGELFPESAFGVSFTLDDTGVSPLIGNAQAAGPGPSEATGSWSPAAFGFSPTETVAWVGIAGTLNVTENDGETVVGSVIGTAITPVQGGVEEASFTLTFRSLRGLGDADCQ